MAQGQAEPEQVCSALEMTGQSRIRRIGTDQSQGIDGLDQDSSKQNSSQCRSNSRAYQTHGRKRHDTSSGAGAGKGLAREGHDRIMPKKDMIDIGKVGQVST